MPTMKLVTDLDFVGVAVALKDDCRAPASSSIQNSREDLVPNSEVSLPADVLSLRVARFARRLDSSA